jgi:hypothetical protein
MRKSEFTIGACWDGRGFYSPEYVNRLYNSCLRNTTMPFDFVLYIGPEAEEKCEGINPAIRIIPVGLPYWWSGFVFWQYAPPGIETDILLYLDLDQVIVGSLDDLVLFPSNQAYMKGYPKHACPNGMERFTCVSTSLLRAGAGHKVWDEYERLGKPQWDPWNPPGDRLLPIGCQSILDDPKHGIKYDLFPEEWICSYKLQVLQKGLPADCRIVAFHGRPKPHEVADQFVKEHWR